MFIYIYIYIYISWYKLYPLFFKKNDDFGASINTDSISQQQTDDDLYAAEAPPTEYTDSNPWYIYECLPFLKDISGFPEGADASSDSNGNSVPTKHNQALVDFIRHTNKNPLDLVNEFLASKKDGEGRLSLSCSPSNSGGSSYAASYESTISDKVGKGYIVKSACTLGNEGRGDVSRAENEMCCSTPWSGTCNKNDEQECFQDFFVCDGGKVRQHLQSRIQRSSIYCIEGFHS